MIKRLVNKLDPIHDWFLIGAEDQIILLANNPLYETGQN